MQHACMGCLFLRHIVRLHSRVFSDGRFIIYLFIIIVGDTEARDYSFHQRAAGMNCNDRLNDKKLLHNAISLLLIHSMSKKGSHS